MVANRQTGGKHLGIRQGATENATVVGELLVIW
jgi:hypothetical protein